jgi:hypothetical protein
LENTGIFISYFDTIIFIKEINMAKKKIATLKKKRPKGKPLCYVDGKGNVRCRKPGRKKGKGSILVKNAVSKDLVKKRKAGKIGLFLKGKVGKTLSVWQGKGWKAALKVKKKRKKRKKAKTKRKKVKRRGRKRKVGRPKLAARKRKSSRCPTFRKKKTLRAAYLCVRRGKGKSIAKRKVYNAALRRCRKSKKYRAKVKGLTLAKI